MLVSSFSFRPDLIRIKTLETLLPHIPKLRTLANTGKKECVEPIPVVEDNSKTFIKTIQKRRKNVYYTTINVLNQKVFPR